MNKHEFQLMAKSFRAGRVSLEQFTSEVFRAENAQENRRVEDVPLPKLPVRTIDAHKGDFGRLLLIGGSVGMAGAIALTGMAALRAGAGLVKIAVPAEAQTTVAAYSSCFMTVGCEHENGIFNDKSRKSLEPELAWASVLVIGPGMGRGAVQHSMIQNIYERSVQPLVVDADALNGLAESKANLKVHAGVRILTPHVGEFKRLIGKSEPARPALEQAAIQFASDKKVIVILKGHETLVTDGQQSFRNTTGNPGMATGGSGDVLGGIIGALLGQGSRPLDAARLAVHWHGLSGDLAAEQFGQHSLIATDIIDALPQAAKQLL